MVKLGSLMARGPDQRSRLQLCRRRLRGPLGAERVTNKVLSDLPHRAGEFAALSQGRVERVDKHIHLAFADDERGQNLDHVHGVAGHLAKDAMLREHLGHDHLREEDLVDLVQEFPGHLELKFVRLVKLNRDHESFAAYFLDEGMFGPQGIEPLDQELPHAGGILDQLFVIDDFERSEAAGHGEIVAAEGSGMHHAAIHPAESLLVDVAPRHDRAARDVAAAQGFGERDDVRFQVPMLEAEHLAGASEAGLDFIADEERSVFPAKLLRANKKVAARIIHSLALHRLDDESRDITFRQLLFEGGDVIERDSSIESLHERSEPFRKTFAAHERKRAEAQSMKRSP